MILMLQMVNSNLICITNALIDIRDILASPVKKVRLNDEVVAIYKKENINQTIKNGQTTVPNN